MAIIQTHTSTSQMSGDGAADHILDGSFGFNLSNAVLKLIDSEHNLHADAVSYTHLTLPTSDLV